jgi:hypothetical protein
MYKVDYNDEVITTPSLKVAIKWVIAFVLVEPFFKTLSRREQEDAALEWVTEV